MTDAADDTFAGLTEYEPVYEMDDAAGALELGFGTSQDDERVSLSRVDSMLLECEESEDVVDGIWPASSLAFEEPDAIPSVFGAASQSLLSDIWAQPDEPQPEEPQQLIVRRDPIGATARPRVHPRVTSVQVKVTHGLPVKPLARLQQVPDPRKSDGSTCSKAARRNYLQRQDEEQVPDPRKSDGSTCSKDAARSYLKRQEDMATDVHNL